MGAATAAEATETALDRAVREAVEAAPKLTPETCDQVALLLSKGDA